MAAFFLIRFRVYDAEYVEHQYEKTGGETSSVASNGEAPTLTNNVHLQQLGPFRKDQPPTRLIKNCHSFCMLLASIGFILAMVGIMCFIWLRLPLSTSVVSSVAVGFCLAGSTLIIFFPGPSDDGSQTSPAPHA